MAKKPDGTKKKTAPKAEKQPKPIKKKGPVPLSYAPKERLSNEYRDNVNARLRDDEHRWRFLVEGMEGSYYVGLRGDNPKAQSFEVRMNQGKTVQFLIIEGEDEIFVPHVWLFIPMDKCRFALGQIGERQRMMLELLKSALDPEIKMVKEARRMQQHGVRISVPQLGIRQELSHYTRGDNEPQKPPMPAQRRIDRFDRLKSAPLTKAILNVKLYNDGEGGLCHLGGYNELKVYFLRERIAGAQKITFLEGGADELLTAIEDQHPMGVSVDVKAVIDGKHSAVTSVDLKDVRNARLHVINWLHHHLGYGKQSEEKSLPKTAMA